MGQQGKDGEMNDTPWKQKEDIDVALMCADRNGFKLVRDSNYPRMICLRTKGSNEHGFVNDITLNAFPDWPHVISYFAGWEKAQLASGLSKIKKQKDKAK